MGSKGGSAPEPPDPRETSAAQTGTSVGTAIANAYLQNPDQQTPFGSKAFTLSDTEAYTYTDPFTGKSYSIPKPSISQEFTPEGQQLQDRNVQTQLNMAQLGQDQSAFLGEYMNEPFSYSPGEYEQWAGGIYEDLNRDSINDQQGQLQTNLVQRGIAPGSEAYNREMENFTGGQQNARNRFMLDAYGTGIDTALTERNQPLREITSLLSGSQPQQPQFSRANIGGIPTTDNAGLINENYRNEYNAWAQEQQQRQGLLGGLFDAGGAIGAAGIQSGWFGSDRRIKADVERVGDAAGLPVYSYRYLGTQAPQIGFMADEVAAVKPWAVRVRHGYAEVNYREALA